MKKKIQKTRVGIIKNMSGNIPGGNFPGWGIHQVEILMEIFQVGVFL